MVLYSRSIIVKHCGYIIPKVFEFFDGNHTTLFLEDSKKRFIPRFCRWLFTEQNIASISQHF